MGPTIILDKSSIQSLSAREIEFLYRYYTINLAPILIIEILGDLMKPDKEGALNSKQVMQLSNKLFQMNSAVNVHYHTLIINALIGKHITMDGRPLVQAKPVQEPNGKRGFLMKESIEEKAIHRWRLGLFTEVEAMLSDTWRESTRLIDLNQFKETYSSIASILPETKSFDQLVMQLDNFLLNPNLEIQTQLLTLIICEFRIIPEVASIIFHRWEQGSFSLVKDFSPYAFYCFRVTLAFYLGLVRNYLTTRPTNRFDLEYVYYLPFANAFSSRDNFHTTVIPAFLRSDQSFILGDELKQDLRTFVDHCDSLDQQQKSEWLKKNGQYPPTRNDSITSRLWQKYANPQDHVVYQSASASKPSATAKNLMERYQSLKPMDESLPDDNDDDSGIDFIVRERTISAKDPCPCGSGKKFKDCHLEQVQKTKNS